MGREGLQAHRREEEVGQRALQGRDRVARLVLEQLALVELDVGAVAAEDGALPELVVGEVDLVRVKSELRLLGYRGGQGKGQSECQGTEAQQVGLGVRVRVGAAKVPWRGR